MIDVTIVVSTFGSRKWEQLAANRAIPSAEQFGVPVIYNHGKNLQDARNAGLYSVMTEYVCHLDADDELHPGFMNAMESVKADLRAPAVRYTRSLARYRHNKDNRLIARMPKVSGHSHDCVADCLEIGNWLVIGTVARTQLLVDVGGWYDYPVYEDYDLWMRCWIAGATVEPVPQAVYIAHSNGYGRNNSLPSHKRRKVHYEIAKTNMPDRNWEFLIS